MAPIETFFEERFRKHADGTIGLGAPLTQRARDMGISHDVISILHGCDTEALRAFSKDDSRKLLGLKAGLFYVGYTGRMREDAICLFAGLIRELRKKYSIDVVGVLIGNSAFQVDRFIGPEIADSFIKTGWIEYEDINQYMSACDVLVLPFENSVARRSIWPSKLNDYLSVGRPVLSTDLVVLSDIVRNAEVGVLAENTVESLAYRCAELLTDPNKMTILGNNARKLAETTLSWETICNTVDKFYNDVTLVACHTIEDQKEVQRKKGF
jgi:glycosyltransferase involved in cell wall biosynthesis